MKINQKTNKKDGKAVDQLNRKPSSIRLYNSNKNKSSNNKKNNKKLKKGKKEYKILLLASAYN